MRTASVASSISARAAQIGQSAVRALLREVAAAPKPGLVDRNGSGSHSDMDFMTFADSALALGPCFRACAREGLERGAAKPAWAGASSRRSPVKSHPTEGDTTEVYAAEIKAADAVETLGAEAPAAETEAADAAFLTALRLIGVEGERLMFAATGGINTHKGALFLVGLQVAAVGALIGAGIPPTADRTRRFAARVVGGVSERELPSAATNGAAAFRAFGSRGVRGEAETALRSLDGGALDFLIHVSERRVPNDNDCINTLLLIMARADDTTVLHRGGPEALQLVQQGARTVLEAGGMTTPAGRTSLARFSADLVSRRISPGGSADLLAAALFLADIEQSYAGNISGLTRPRSKRLVLYQTLSPGQTPLGISLPLRLS